ncbi:MAG: anhydro-N-acetylmuramic acid kinase [Rickettsiaceae bacterium]
MSDLYIGFMSGTSCDGVDASLVQTDGKDFFHSIDNIHIPYPLDFRTKLQELCTYVIPFFEIETRLTEFHSTAATRLLEKTQYTSKDIKALGFHGQTILHDPAKHATWQIGNPHLLAQATGIDVIHDFRRRDLSLGGQGAPLVPIFHKLIVNGHQYPVAIINIGGVANITYINQEKLIAFDTGPGNALINDAMLEYFGQDFDDEGQIAATGKVDESVVNKFLNAEYFKLPYPKSLDRNSFRFMLDALKQHLPKDIVATLTYISAAAIVKSIAILPDFPQKILLCGGGSKNKQLVEWVRTKLLTQGILCKVEDISSIKGFDADYVESQAFAYLAARFFKNLPSAFPSTTSASRESICGCLVRASK